MPLHQEVITEKLKKKITILLGIKSKFYDLNMYQFLEV